MSAAGDRRAAHESAAWQAKLISAAPCEHETGRVHVRLHNAAGVAVAVGCLDVDLASLFLEQLATAIEHAAFAKAGVAGHA